MESLFSVDRRLRCSQDLLVFESTTTCLWSKDHLPSLSIRESQSGSWFTFYTALGTFLAECFVERANLGQRGLREYDRSGDLEHMVNHKLGWIGNQAKVRLNPKLLYTKLFFYQWT